MTGTKTEQQFQERVAAVQVRQRAGDVPFDVPLIDVGIRQQHYMRTVIMGFAVDDNHLVRVYDIGTFDTERARTALTERFDHFCVALEGLGQHGIRHPQIRQSFGPGIGPDSTMTDYVLMERVHGKPTLKLPETVSRMMFEQTAEYYERVVRDGGWYIDDLHLGNMMSGSVVPGLPAKPYFIDMEISTARKDEARGIHVRGIAGTILRQSADQLRTAHQHRFTEYEALADKMYDK